MNKNLLILALAALAADAQAATWSLGDTTTGGMRNGYVALTDTAGGMGTAGDALFGSIGNDLNEITVDSVAVGSWGTTRATLGGNGIDLGLSHEAYAGAAYLGNAQTAYANLKTSVSLDNAHIVDSGLDLDFSGYAPARLSQSFIITPELGEMAGNLVNVKMVAWADHALAGNLSGSSLSFEQGFHSSYTLYLNGTAINANIFETLGHVGGNWNFQAQIGDEITLDVRSHSQIGSEVQGLAIGATPEALATSEVFASMTVTPVPEPESWAMLLMGLGLVGLRLRSKAKSFTYYKIGA